MGKLSPFNAVAHENYFLKKYYTDLNDFLNEVLYRRIERPLQHFLKNLKIIRN
jgi:hypothetical protein